MMASSSPCAPAKPTEPDLFGGFNFCLFSAAAWNWTIGAECFQYMSTYTKNTNGVDAQKRTERDTGHLFNDCGCRNLEQIAIDIHVNLVYNKTDFRCTRLYLE